MATKLICESCTSSFFLIDKNYKLNSFVIDSMEDLGVFLSKNLVIGEQVVEFVAQRYIHTLLDFLSKSFDGHCFSVEKRLPIADAEDIIFQITFTPIHFNGEVQYVNCTLVNSNRIAKQLRLLNEYSHVTSHQLRAPITNIISLSSRVNYPQIENYDYVKVHELLGDIHKQAEKLDDITRTLNSLLHENGYLEFFQPELVNRESKHIVLIDDDVLTNRIHQMLIMQLDEERKLALFENPNDALGYIIKHTPDLILLDLQMPEMDGWGFLQILHDHQILVDVVIISSSIDPLERSRAKNFRSVKNFLTKPLTYEKVKSIFN